MSKYFIPRRVCTLPLTITLTDYYRSATVQDLGPGERVLQDKCKAAAILAVTVTHRRLLPLLSAPLQAISSFNVAQREYGGIQNRHRGKFFNIV